MACIMIRSTILTFGLLIVIAGCSGGASTSAPSTSVTASTSASSASGGQSEAGSSDTELAPYPDWIRPIVPLYPNATSGYLMDKKGGYVIESKDDLDTIIAWYKSHLPGSWTTDEAAGKTSTLTNGLKVEIVKDQINKPPVTMIQLSKP